MDFQKGKGLYLGERKKDEGVMRSIGFIFGSLFHLADCFYQIKLSYGCSLEIDGQLFEDHFGRTKMSILFSSFSFLAVLWLSP